MNAPDITTAPTILYQKNEEYDLRNVLYQNLCQRSLLLKLVSISDSTYLLELCKKGLIIEGKPNDIEWIFLEFQEICNDIATHIRTTLGESQTNGTTDSEDEKISVRDLLQMHIHVQTLRLIRWSIETEEKIRGITQEVLNRMIAQNHRDYLEYLFIFVIKEIRAKPEKRQILLVNNNDLFLTKPILKNNPLQEEEVLLLTQEDAQSALCVFWINKYKLHFSPTEERKNLMEICIRNRIALDWAYLTWKNFSQNNPHTAAMLKATSGNLEAIDKDLIRFQESIEDVSRLLDADISTWRVNPITVLWNDTGIKVTPVLPEEVQKSGKQSFAYQSGRFGNVYLEQRLADFFAQTEIVSITARLFASFPEYARECLRTRLGAMTTLGELIDYCHALSIKTLCGIKTTPDWVEGMQCYENLQQTYVQYENSRKTLLQNSGKKPDNRCLSR